MTWLDTYCPTDANFADDTCGTATLTPPCESPWHEPDTCVGLPSHPASNDAEVEELLADIDTAATEPAHAPAPADTDPDDWHAVRCLVTLLTDPQVDRLGVLWGPNGEEWHIGETARRLAVEIEQQEGGRCVAAWDELHRFVACLTDAAASDLADDWWA